MGGGRQSLSCYSVYAEVISRPIKRAGTTQEKVADADDGLEARIVVRDRIQHGIAATSSAPPSTSVRNLPFSARLIRRDRRDRREERA